MQTIIDLAKSLGEMPPGALYAFVTLSGFGLAAYAIHAMLTVAKGRDRP